MTTPSTPVPTSDSTFLSPQDDWFISPPLPNRTYDWRAHNPQTREEVEAYFHSPAIQELKELMCDIGRRLWAREYVDGNGGNMSIRVAHNLILCTPTLASKGFLKPEDLCFVDMESRQKAGIRPSTSEIKTHIAMMKSINVDSCIHSHPPHCNAFLIAGQVPPSGINSEADIFIGHVALAPYSTPGTPLTAQRVAEAAKKSQVVFMENHGVIAGARFLEEAFWFLENADAYCRTILLASAHKAPLKQVSVEDVKDMIAIRSSIGLPTPEGQEPYNTDTYAGYKLLRPE